MYREIDSLAELEGRIVKTVHAFCFYKEKLVIVYAPGKGIWAPPGGSAEQGESIEQAVAREVVEETNMRVVRQKLIGYQDIFEPHGVVTQTRSVCLVEPLGLFVSDPGGDITEVKLIDPKNYKKYFDWGEVGDYLMKRSLESLKNLK